MARLSVLTLAGDPGGAAALSPVLKRISAEGEGLAVYAYRQAIDHFKQQALPVRILSESSTQEDCRRLIESHRPDVVLTATSVNGIDLEKKMIAAARERGVPVLALLDFWSNYRQRFDDECGELAFIPDRIAVMDERAIDEMGSLGFPAECLVATGQPALDQLSTRSPEDKLRTRQTVRSRLGLAPAESVIAFMSQPLEDFYGLDLAQENPPGYTEKSVFASLLKAVGNLRSDHDLKALRVIVKPHPRERPESWDDMPLNAIPVQVDWATPSHDLVIASDLVVGMTSVILIEAALLGCSVVSIQPGLASPRENVLRGFPRIDTCVSAGELGSFFAGALSRPGRAPGGEKAPGPDPATPRVIKALRQLVRWGCANRQAPNTYGNV